MSRAASLRGSIARLRMRLRSSLAGRAGRWARRRQGLDTLPVTLVARRIYILPSRAGLGFAALLFVMLLAGLNYGNSLALFLTFVLGGFGLVAMHQCHRILLGLRIRLLSAQAVFAGEPVRVDVVVENPTATAKTGLLAAVRLSDPAASGSLLKAKSASTANSTSGGGELDLAPHSGDVLRAVVATSRRGRLPIQRIELASSAPFGLFRAWAWLHASFDVIVYPRPAGNRPPPLTSGEREGNRIAGAGEDEWVDLRAFRQGDSPRQVAWKAYARGAPLLVREYRALGAQARSFELAQLPGLPLEVQLSQLARWIVDAEARGERYGLRLAGQRIEMGSGQPHRHRCLSALALHDADPVAPR